MKRGVTGYVIMLRYLKNSWDKLTTLRACVEVGAIFRDSGVSENRLSQTPFIIMFPIMWEYTML